MKIETLIQKISLLLSLSLSAFIGFALFGGFNFENVTIILWIFGIISILFILKNFILDKQRISFDYTDIVAFVIIAIFCGVAYTFHHDFSQGRDEMVHLVSAVKLTESQSLAFKDTLGHTFSGFHELRENIFTSQFLPGYIVSIGTAILFGTTETAFATNAFILFFGLFAIYFVGKELKNGTLGLVILSLFGTLYPALWFSKRLNSEILFFTLFWIGIWYFFTAIKNNQFRWYIASFLPFSLLLLTRGEATLFFLTYTFFSLVYITKHAKEKTDRVFKKRHIFLLVPSFINIFFMGYYLLKYNSYYFTSQINNFYSAFTSFSPLLLISGFLFLILASLGYFLIKMRSRIDMQKYKQRGLLLFILMSLFSIIGFFIYSVWSDTLSWSFYRIEFSIEIFILYFLFIFILLIFRGLFLQIFKREHFYLTLFILPSFIFLIEHNIAPDQPWFMRRFFAILIPYLVILGSYTLVKTTIVPEKKILYITTILIINITIALPTLFFVDNKGISNQIKSFSAFFSKDDLLIMEPGWDWQKWAYPMRYLYGVNTLPNLNIQNSNATLKPLLIEKMTERPNWQNQKSDLLAIKQFHEEKQIALLQPFVKKAGNVYVLTPSSFDFPHYDEQNMSLVENDVFSYTTLAPSTELLGYIKTNGNHMDIRTIRQSQQNTPPRKTTDIRLDLLLLKVNDVSALTTTDKMSDAQVVSYREFLEELIENN